VDNEWVDDHFKSEVISEDTKFEEIVERNEILGEDFVKIIVSGWKMGNVARGTGGFPGFEVPGDERVQKKEVKIVFVPYFYRGNRGGRGHMRVGFKSS
jgi:uncharacterized protein